MCHVLLRSSAIAPIESLRGPGVVGVPAGLAVGGGNVLVSGFSSEGEGGTGIDSRRACIAVPGAGYEDRLMEFRAEWPGVLNGLSRWLLCREWPGVEMGEAPWLI